MRIFLYVGRCMWVCVWKSTKYTSDAFFSCTHVCVYQHACILYQKIMHTQVSTNTFNSKVCMPMHRREISWNVHAWVHMCACVCSMKKNERDPWTALKNIIWYCVHRGLTRSQISIYIHENSTSKRLCVCCVIDCESHCKAAARQHFFEFMHMHTGVQL